jgi:ATP-dependent Clp protease ATP-binding subunit ClpC
MTAQKARPYTSRAQRALAAADDNAASLNHGFIGTEHILLGLLADRGSPAGEILDQLGVTTDLVHEEMRRMKTPPPDDYFIAPPNEEL